MNSDNKENIVIVSHKFTTQPDDDFAKYLVTNRYSNVMHITHSFFAAQDRKSWYSWYKNGEIYKEEHSKDFKNLPEALLYLKELYFTFSWIYKTGIKWDLYVGMDGLCTLFGLILKAFTKVKRCVYWVIDFVPQSRFNSKLKNNIYKYININSYKNADEVWDLSPRMAQARKEYWNLNLNTYKNLKVVPYGIWSDAVRTFSYDDCDKNTLVFMGVLVEKQGVQLVIQALPQLVNQYPNFTFKIIGGGDFEGQLKELSESLGVAKYCKFFGKIKNEDYEKVLLYEIAKSTVAIAPYIKELDTWTYYADPGKVKTYLSCGVPVLLTPLPWNAREIEEHKCGIVIEETAQSIIDGVHALFESEKNEEYRRNAKEYAKNFEYNKIFEGLGY